MKRKMKAVSVFALFLLFIFNGSSALAAGNSRKVERIAGSNRVETAIEVSKKAYPGQVETLFLAGYLDRNKRSRSNKI